MEASAPPTRSEAQILRSLVENGVAKRFDLRAWCEKGCSQPNAMERLEVLLEQVRPDVAKLIVLEELEGTAEEDADVLVYGEIAAREKIIAIEPFRDKDGIGRCRLVMQPKVIAVSPRPMRPFQGWRYLTADSAPSDLTKSSAASVASMPEPMRRELRDLGLL